jgi:hypothetical protein
MTLYGKRMPTKKLTEKDRAALRVTRGPRSESSEISRMKIFQRICGRPIVHRTETREDGKKRQKTGGIRDHAGVADFLSPQSKESQ